MCMSACTYVCPHLGPVRSSRNVTLLPVLSGVGVSRRDLFFVKGRSRRRKEKNTRVEYGLNYILGLYSSIPPPLSPLLCLLSERNPV